jgi:hypothetical protein
MVLNDPQVGSDLVLNAMMQGVDVKPQLQNFFVAGGRLNAKNAMDILMDESCSSCLVPGQLSSSNVQETSAAVSFNLVDEANSYTFFYRAVGASSWNEMTVTASPINLSGLAECTEYEYYINSVCPEENSNDSQITTFKTKGCGACIDLTYCDINTSENPPARLVIHSPVSLATTITNFTLTSGWGGSLTNGYVYGDMALVADGSANPDLGCEALTNAGLINGKIAVAVRGTCNFSDKALNAQNAGAIAMVIINNQANAPATLGAGGSSGSVTIPVIMISETAGAALLAALQNGDKPKALLGAQNEWIQSFEMAGETFVTGDNGGYTGAIETSLELTAGASFPFQITPGFSGQALPEYSRIWLDANQDGTFSNDELIYDQGSASETPTAGVCAVPASAQMGLTRIRVQMAYQGYGAAPLSGTCGTFQSGETEDYCVTIIEPNASIDGQNNTNFIIYPNPSNGQLFINTDATVVQQINILSLTGQVVKTITDITEVMNIDMNSCADGVYVIHAFDADGVVVSSKRFVVSK